MCHVPLDDITKRKSLLLQKFHLNFATQLGYSPGKNTGVGCHFLLQCMKVKSESEVTQSCPALSDPMDCSPPGSSFTFSQQRKMHILSNHHVCGANHISVHVIATIFPSVHLLYNMLCFTNKKANTCLKTVLSPALQQVHVGPKYLQIYNLRRGHRKICTG